MGYRALLTHIVLILFQIINMRVTESGHLEYYLEYIDYTEEGKHIFTEALFFSFPHNLLLEGIVKGPCAIINLKTHF